MTEIAIEVILTAEIQYREVMNERYGVVQRRIEIERETTTTKDCERARQRKTVEESRARGLAAFSETQEHSNERIK